MRDEERDEVLAVKRGEWRLPQVLTRVEDLARSIEEVLSTPGASPLPEHPDLELISMWSVSAHRRWWGWTEESR